MIIKRANRMKTGAIALGLVWLAGCVTSAIAHRIGAASLSSSKVWQTAAVVADQINPAHESKLPTR